MLSCFKDKKFLKRFLEISLPVMLSSFISFLVSFLDNVMVGTVSNEVVSGVYAANEVTFVFNLASFGLLESAGIFIQQFCGAKDEEHIKDCFRYKIIASIVFMITIMPIVYLCGKYLINVFCWKDSAHEMILQEGIKYLNVVAISYIPYMIGLIYSTSLREIGETKYTMYSSLIAILCNVIFNAIFIMGFKMGGIGAAIGTILSRVFETAYLMIISEIKKFSFYKGVFKNFKINHDLFHKINKKGVLLFINEIGFSFGVIAQSLAFSQRDNVLSAISIVTTVSNVCQILITGLSIGIGVMVGSSLGAGEFEKAKDENRKLNQLGFYLSVTFGIILVALSFVIPYMFSKVNQEQKELATFLIIIYSCLLWARTLCITSYYTLRTGGKAGLTFLFDTGLMIVLYIPISWLLAYFTDLSLIYIYLIVNCIDVGKCIMGLVLMKKGSWVNNLTYHQEQK